MPKAELFTIGEFSAMTGVGIHSLRYYDEIGALKPEYVDPVSNYRYYGLRQLSLMSQGTYPLTHLFIMQLTAFVPSSSMTKASFSELQR